MRVASVDIGTNSTRLLVADVDPAAATRGAGAQQALARDPPGCGRGRLGKALGGGRGARLSDAVRVPRGDRPLRLRGEHRGAHLGRAGRRQRARVRRPGSRRLRARRPRAGGRAGGPADVHGGDVRTRTQPAGDRRDRRRRGLHRVRRRPGPHGRLPHVAERRGGADERAPHPLRSAHRRGAPGARRGRAGGLLERAPGRRSPARSPPASPSPAPPPRRRRSTSGSTPTTPSGSTAIRSRWEPSSSSCGGCRRWTKRSGARWWA